LFHIDLDIDARNTVIQKAQNLSRCAVEEEPEPASKRKQLEFEDVGGDHVEQTIDELELVLKTAKGFCMDPKFNAHDVKSLLTREAEVSGRTKESYKQMLGVADVLEEAMDLFMQPSARLHFDEGFDDVLKRFQENAGVYRSSLDGSKDCGTEEAPPMTKISSDPEALLIDLDDVMQGRW